MNEYLLITGLIFKNAFRSDKLKLGAGSGSEKAKKIRNAVLLAALLLVGFAPILFGFCYMIYVYSEAMAMSGVHADLYGMLLSVSQVVVLVFGMVSVVSVLYKASDLEFLGQLPVKPSVVFWAKMTYVYVTEAVIAIAMIVPATASFVMGVQKAGVELPALFYVLTPIAVFVAPVVPLLFANLLAMPIIFVTKRLKNRTYTGLIVAAVLYIGIMFAYTMVMKKFGNASGDEEGNIVVTDEMIKSILLTSKIFFFNRWLALSMCGAKALDLLFYVLFLAAMVGVCYLVSSTFFKKNAKNALENSGEGGKKTSAAIVLEPENVKKALIKREWKMLVGEFNFAINTLLSVIMPFVLLGFMTITGASGGMSGIGQEEGQELSKGAEMMVSAGFALIYGIFCTCGIDYAASIAFSREGKTFYINKYLPLNPEDVIDAKVALADIIGLAGAIVTGVSGAIFLKTGFHSVGIIVVSALYNLGFNRLGVLRDLKKPSLGWTNPAEATKKNFYPMVPMFYAIGVGVVEMIAAMALTELKSDALAAVIFYAVSIAVAVPFTLINAKRLKTKGVEYFERIEQSV